MRRYRDPRKYYAGRIADEYDVKRIPKERWGFDMQSLPKMLSGIESVLDCPVGTGRFLPIYNEAGIDATGVDVSEDMLEKSRIRGFSSLQVGDATALPFEDKRFDAVVCIRLFIHLQPDDMRQAAAEFCRVAKKAIVIDAKISSHTTVPYRGAITHSRESFLAAFEGWRIEKSSGPSHYPMMRLVPLVG